MMCHSWAPLDVDEEAVEGTGTSWSLLTWFLAAFGYTDTTCREPTDHPPLCEEDRTYGSGSALQSTVGFDATCIPIVAAKKSIEF